MFKNRLILLGVFLATAAFASAQVPKGNIFVGYSYARGDLTTGQATNLNGWEASLEGKVFPFLGVVVDFSDHYGGTDVQGVHVDGHEWNILFGPRLSASVSKFRPFAQVLIGLGHVHDSGAGFSASDNTFTTVVGGGLDYRLVHGIAWRFQGDYLQTRFFSGRQDNARFSTGLVLNF